MSFYAFNDYPAPAKQPYSAAYDHLFGPANFDLLAPHPDLFESELDASADLGVLSALDTSILDQQNAFGHPAFFAGDYRNGYHGPASSITVSSESQSGYDFDTASTYYSSHDSSSVYVPQAHPASEVDLDFGPDFTLAPPTIAPPVVPRIPSLAGLGLDTLDLRRPVTQQQQQFQIHPTAYIGSSPVSPVSAHAPVVPSHDSPKSRTRSPSVVQESRSERDRRLTDSSPAKKYPCSQCSRSFARAFNLKTHMTTHDPNRVKSFVCRHPGCGRSFSRKHDLGRHLTSIHAAAALTEAPSVSGLSTSTAHRAPNAKRGVPLGGEKSNRDRVWCDGCGRGWIKGMREACECDAWKHD